MFVVSVDSQNVQREIQILRRRKLSRFRASLIERVMDRAVSATRARTPVDTGEARDGWDSSNLELSEQAESSERKLTNRVEHIVYLEDGTRRIKPRQMVKRSLAEVSQSIPGIARELFHSELG